jgi:LysR family glycine cleavage system transcriptional activator
MEDALASPLPSIGMLRAFESAARLLSFTRAADDLGLTQTAISHTIRKLEAAVGQSLFEREGNRLALTRAGRDFLPVARGVIESLSISAERLREQASFSTLTVASVLSFSVNWLLPRIGDFSARHPDIRLQVGANLHLDDTPQPDTDIAILYGNGQWLDHVVHPLFSEEITPVCAPSLLAGGGAIRDLDDLARHRLLRTSFYFRHRDDWQPWLAAAGHEPGREQETISFDLLFSSLEAARLGLGIAMGRTPLIADDLRAGRLICPFDLRLPTPQGYYLLARPQVAQTPKYRAFRDWIMAQARATQPWPAPVAG